MPKNSSVAFWVPGPPRPKQRPRFSQRGVVYTPAETLQYEDAVATYAKMAGAEPQNGPVAVGIFINAHGRWDIDNCAKSVLDGLNHVAYEDDHQVAILYVAKNRPEPGQEDGVYVVVHYIKQGSTKR